MAGDADGLGVEIPLHQPEHPQLGAQCQSLGDKCFDVGRIIGHVDIRRRSVGADVVPGEIGQFVDRRHERPPRRAGRHTCIVKG